MEKLKMFSRNRRALAHALAQKLHKSVPAEVDKFFDLLEGGDWETTQAVYRDLRMRAGHDDSSKLRELDLDGFWRPLVEAYGAAQQTHLWPAQQLLDYGNAVLGALGPGMVYVGGTDSGCFIPTMLNETGDSENGPHVMFTQNALADGSYMDYLRFQYGGQLALPTAEDIAGDFQQYLTDAQARLEHDEQRPDEPKQLAPGENVTLDDSGKAQVSGQVAVMKINGLILQNILNQNPSLSFAMEESFSLPETYSGAFPVGPIYQLRAGDGQSALTDDSVTQSLDYWRGIAQQLLSDPASASSDAALKTWSHDLSSEANLLAAAQFPGQAEEAYQLALQISPSNPDAAASYLSLLMGQDRTEEAAALVATLRQKAPDSEVLPGLAQQVSQRQRAGP